MNKIACFALGMVLGLVIMDAIYWDAKTFQMDYDYNFAKLLLAEGERPDHCPYCKEKFYYFYTWTDDEIQDLMNKYTGKGE